MQPSQRVFINTIAQYTRTIINMVLSLYTIRLVLSCLGQDDFGIYTLVAGIVSMLSFLTNSLVNTTQRFVSYYQGKNDIENLKLVFNNSLVVHILLGFFMVVLLEAAFPFLFSGFLNIPIDRIVSAKIVYQTVVVMLMMTFLSSPYRALLISHENIVYISVIDVLDGIIKVILVVLMTFTSYDKLIIYGFIMMGIQMFNFFAMSTYSYSKYTECIFPKFKFIRKKNIKEILSFAGWNVYGTGCSIGQKQGIAIVLNRFWGNAINAAYGIGFQLAGYASFLSTSIINAIQPQIIKAEGSGNRQHALKLSIITSKIVFFLMSIVFIPTIFEIETILKIWLGTPPDYASLFCIMAIITLLVDSFTIGLTYINVAIGNIGLYTVVMNTPKLLTFPISWFFIKCGLPLLSVVILFICVEFLMAMVRILFIKRTAGLDARDFMINVILRELVSTTIAVGTCLFVVYYIHSVFRIFFTFSITIILYLVSFYFIGFTNEEKRQIKAVFKNILSKFVN